MTPTAQTLAAIAAYWVFSALVGGMPDPDASSSKGYQWAYKSLHLLSGNITTAVAARFPALPEGTTLKQATQTTITTESK